MFKKKNTNPAPAVEEPKLSAEVIAEMQVSESPTTEPPADSEAAEKLAAEKEAAETEAKKEYAEREAAEKEAAGKPKTKKAGKKVTWPDGHTRCPRCGADDTEAYSTRKNIQYRRCSRAICRHNYTVRAKKRKSGTKV